LDALVEDLVGLYGPAFAQRSIRLERRRGAALTSPVEADREQLEQALINVIENAGDAVGAGGEVRLTTVEDDGVAVLLVEDDGPGLGAAAVDELFTPFFTTKPEGQGLGLTLVKEVLRNHGFPFALENRDGPGCRFRVRFEA
ncbi:MAG: ATP-binding protein, partial [Acidobacteriota bacterium]